MVFKIACLKARTPARLWRAHLFNYSDGTYLYRSISMYFIYFTIHTVLVSPAKARHQVKLPTHTPKSTQDKPKQVKPSQVESSNSTQSSSTLATAIGRGARAAAATTTTTIMTTIATHQDNSQVGRESGRESDIDRESKRSPSSRCRKSTRRDAAVSCARRFSFVRYRLANARAACIVEKRKTVKI